ncbi:hypothetical protein FRB99_004524 [Tulasnella sp. 403]|nr:hypothetical protein FRB99_004524 [Tulasnella sp. 403]
MSTTSVLINDPRIIYTCPNGGAKGWELVTLSGTDPSGTPFSGKAMQTQGGGCYAEFNFTASGISFSTVQAFDHSVYGCSIDGSNAQWFNPSQQSNVWRTGCIIKGLDSSRHTLRVFTSPLPGFFFTMSDLTLYNDPYGSGSSSSFMSDMPAYNMPAALASFTNPNATGYHSPCDPKTKVTGGAIAGLVIEGIVILVLATLVFVFARRAKRAAVEPESPQAGEANHVRPVSTYSVGSTAMLSTTKA